MFKAYIQYNDLPSQCGLNFNTLEEAQAWGKDKLLTSGDRYAALATCVITDDSPVTKIRYKLKCMHESLADAVVEFEISRMPAEVIKYRSNPDEDAYDSKAEWGHDFSRVDAIGHWIAASRSVETSIPWIYRGYEISNLWCLGRASFDTWVPYYLIHGRSGFSELTSGDYYKEAYKFLDWRNRR